WTQDAGWDALPPVRVAHANNAQGDAIAVDESGVAYLVWVDTSPVSTIYYSKGRGNSFSAPVAPFADWARKQVTKDVSLDYNNGYLHLAFSSPIEDPLKDNYYSNMQVSAPASKLTTPPLPPAGPIPGAGSRTFPETGQTVTG